MKINQKLFKQSLITASFATIFALPITQAFATPPPPPTVVSGVISDTGGRVSGASITVTCSNGHHLSTTSTSAPTGANYSVSFASDAAHNCPNADSVTVQASKGTETGSNNGTVSSESATVNVTISNPVSVPEFNSLTGLAAFVTAAGAFILLRKKSII